MLLKGGDTKNVSPHRMEAESVASTSSPAALTSLERRETAGGGSGEMTMAQKASISLTKALMWRVRLQGEA